MNPSLPAPRGISGEIEAMLRHPTPVAGQYFRGIVQIYHLLFGENSASCPPLRVHHSTSPAQDSILYVIGISLMKQSLLLLLVAAGIIADGLCADPSATLLAGLAPAEIAHTVKAGGFSLNLANNGSIISAKIGNTGWPLSADTRLRGFRQQGETVVKSTLPNQACTFTRTLVDAKGHTCTVTDRFTPTRDSIRWEVEITSAGKPWSTSITTGFNYAATANSRFWTTWGHPDNDPKAWADPLAWQPLANRTWGYQFGNSPMISPTWETSSHRSRAWMKNGPAPAPNPRHPAKALRRHAAS
jgi:hypothetical protein